MELERDTQNGLTDEEMRQNVIRLAFNGRAGLFDAFCDAIEEVVPPGTTVVLRGSAVTGLRWKDGAPFDADGEGTSDLDLTLALGQRSQRSRNANFNHASPPPFLPILNVFSKATRLG